MLARRPSTRKAGPIDEQFRPLSDRLSHWLFIGAVLLGIAGSAVFVAFSALKALSKDKYCLILHDDFSKGIIDPAIWSHEVETGGFGNHEFQWTTSSTNNSYVEDGKLHIVPTLSEEHFGSAAISDGYALNLTRSGRCTASNWTDASCAVVSNRTAGVILPPVQSARLTTQFSRGIQYGKVEVRARMPTGDWLWPAIWMLPSENKYGEWPMSGEIDIVETKGNRAEKRSDTLNNVIKSTLHWGPIAGDSYLDRFWKRTKERKLWRNFYDQDFHTFGLEWTEKELFTWEGSPATRILQHRFSETNFWRLGKFPFMESNGTTIHNPWAESHRAPFDQRFYLILNVAVGGTNGYFEDHQHDNKPWSNSAPNARTQFWEGKDEWLPSWPTDPAQRGMVVDYVKMWQKC